MSKLIAVESIDGAGGTTVADALTTAMRDDDITCHKTAEPTGTPIGSLLRRYGDACPPMQQLFMFLADRAHHQQYIKHALNNESQHVVCDRYIGSTIAYQAPQIANEYNMKVDNVEQMIDEMHDPWCRRPDIIVWIDVPPNRLDDRRGEDIFEDYETQLEADSSYNVQHGLNENMIRLDGRQERDEMIDDAVSKVMERLS